MNRTDDEIVRQHWRGGGDVVSLINSVASIAPMILPKRIRRVLESRVEVKPKGKTATAAALASAEPVLVEIAD
jgi:hypothetical protein